MIPILILCYLINRQIWVLKNYPNLRYLKQKKTKPNHTPLPRVLLVEVLRSGLESGLGIAQVLSKTGARLPNAQGRALILVAETLTNGLPWEEAWQTTEKHATAEQTADLSWLQRHLEQGWKNGNDLALSLQLCKQTLFDQVKNAGEQASGKLGAKIVLPLGLCFLPAFICLGLVPVLTHFLMQAL